MNRIVHVAVCGLLMLVGGALIPGPVVAQAPAVRLVSAVAEASPSDQARGAFLIHNMIVRIDAPTVILASTPDGRGPICTDDEVRLALQAPGRLGQEWRYLFADSERQGITCLPPQQLSVRAGPGEYAVRIELYDRFPFTYSSRPYYLVGAAPAGHSGTVQSVVTPRATVGPAQTTTVTPAATATSIPTPAAVAIAPAAPLAQSSPTAVPAPTEPPPAPVEARAVQAPAFSLPLLALLLGLLLLAVALAALFFAGRRRRTRSTVRLSGILDVLDHASGESRTVLLHSFPSGAAILRAPLQVVALDPAAAALQHYAVLEAGPNGPQIRIDGAEAAEPIDLRSGEPVRIADQLELRYRM